MSLQAQGTNLSERIVFELRSKNPDVKVRAANELKDLVLLYARGQCRCYW
jgi:hypothetical protein